MNGFTHGARNKTFDSLHDLCRIIEVVEILPTVDSGFENNSECDL